MSLEDYIRNQERKLKEAAERGKEGTQNAWDETKRRARDASDTING